MSLKVEPQIAALNAVIEVLDEALQRNPSWQALADLDAAMARDRSAPDPVFTRLRLEQDLSRDPIYRARLRLVESIQMLQQVDTSPRTECETHATQADETPKSPDQFAPHDHTDPHKTGVEQSSDDDLTKIRGVTRAIHENLRTLGVTTFAQIAAWTGDERKRIADALSLGRVISQQNWIEQAALLEAKKPQNHSQEHVQHTPAASDVSKTHASAKANQSPASEPVSVPTNDKTVVSHLLIANAAQNVVGRLVAQNDTTAFEQSEIAEPVENDDSETRFIEECENPSADVVQTKANTPAKIVLEGDGKPRAVQAQTYLQDDDKKPEPDHKSLALVSEMRARAPKKFRRRRWVRTKAKIKRGIVPESADQDLAGTEAASQTDRLVAEASVHVQGKDSPVAANRRDEFNPNPAPILPTSPNPLTQTPRVSGNSAAATPPPIPDKVRRRALRSREWPRQPMSNLTGNNSGGFGDGAKWRQGSPEVSGPTQDADLGAPTTGPNLLAHAEEAHVEIIRRHPAGPHESDPGSAVLRTQRDDAPREDAPPKENFGVRLPSRGLFRALKRE